MSKENLVFSSSLSYASGRGDWIPEIYKKIFVIRGYTDLVLCHVFSKIVYWHSPSKSGKKKYGGKLPFLSNNILAEQTGLSLKQVRRATESLEKEYKFIVRSRNGRKTHLDLNKENITEVFLPHMRELGSEDILIMSSKTEDSSVPSRAHEDNARLPSRAHEGSYAGPTGHAYNIKGNHKLNTEIRLAKKSDLESECEDKLFQLKSNSMSEEDYLLACKIVSVFVDTQLSNDVDPSAVFKDFLSNHLIDQVAYPGFARLHCICNMSTFADMSVDGIRKLLYVVKGECVGNPDLAKMLIKHCPSPDYAAAGLDLDEYVCKSKQALSKIFDEALIKTKELETYDNES